MPRLSESFTADKIAIPRHMDPKSLKFIAAPMVNQSDLPFRSLAENHGATLTYTQMLAPDRLLNDQEYLEFHTRDLTMASVGKKAPVVVQLCGNDPELVVKAGRKIEGLCDGIDLNLGCPQDVARGEHFGAYLLGQKDWPLVESIVSSMSRSLGVPISAKLRLCQPTPKTRELAKRLEAQGASWITLHARTVSARRRRQGAADLSVVKELKTHLKIPTISNGNVRIFADLQTNLEFTGADGLMVGETLLGNPRIFSGDAIPDPVDISLEYLELCSKYPGTASLHTIQTHIRHFVEFQCHRKPWYTKFRTGLMNTKSAEEIEHFLRYKVERWRGRSPRGLEMEEEEENEVIEAPTSNSGEDILDVGFLQ